MWNSSYFAVSQWDEKQLVWTDQLPNAVRELQFCYKCLSGLVNWHSTFLLTEKYFSLQNVTTFYFRGGGGGGSFFLAQMGEMRGKRSSRLNLR